VAVSHIVAWVAVALFFAIVMTPPVDHLQHKLKVRRGVATLAVFFVTLLVLGAMISAFVYPLVDQSTKFADNLPQAVEDARNGKGAVGDLVDRFNLEQWVDDNQDKLRDTVSGFGAPAVDIVRRVFATIFAALTIVVMTILMVLEGPKFSASALGMVPQAHRERVRRVGVDSSRAVSGYVFGNLVISLIAGLTSWVALKILGVPYAEVLALFVAFADLIPMIGATLGAAPTVLFAFLHSVTAGVSMLIFFIVYQQFENHVLQVSIMARTVKLNPLTVFISVLMGIQLLGMLGGLLAIPVAGVVQVIVRDWWDARGGHLVDEPDDEEDEATPVSGLAPAD